MVSKLGAVTNYHRSPFDAILEAINGPSRKRCGRDSSLITVHFIVPQLPNIPQFLLYNRLQVDTF